MQKEKLLTHLSLEKCFDANQANWTQTTKELETKRMNTKYGQCDMNTWKKAEFEILPTVRLSSLWITQMKSEASTLQLKDPKLGEV